MVIHTYKKRLKNDNAYLKINDFINYTSINNTLFFIVRPILLSIVGGLILAFILYPLYFKLKSWTKLPKLSALIICVGIILIILLPILFFSPAILEEFF